MFERQHVQAAKAYARKPKPGAGSTPFFTKASASEPAAKKSRTEEPTESGSRPNLPPDAGTGAFKNPCFEWFQSLLFASQSLKASIFGNRFRSSFCASTKSGLVIVFVSCHLPHEMKSKCRGSGGNFCADPVKKSGSGTGLFLKARPRFSAHSSPILFKSDLSQNRSGSC